MRENRIMVPTGSMKDINVKITAQGSMIITADPGKHGEKRSLVSINMILPAEINMVGNADIKEKETNSEKKMTKKKKRHAKKTCKDHLRREEKDHEGRV
ncbi:hypothetical protein OXIME_001441 [Oxyplasma meridianum]|uniref:Chaperone DnaJ C-terminal domain-containing protein n=1 Tax=Oxyplasma meridianum TaxID=3073602 RepID=A0AAX4NHA8_9ARCH